MNSKLNIILSIALVVLGILYFKSCEQSLHVEPVVLTKTDSLYIKGDEVLVPFEVIKWKTKWLKPDAVETFVDSSTNDTINIFNTEIDDSLLTATITSKVKGELLSSSLSYSPKFPKYIYRVDTLQINDSTTIEVDKPKYGLYFGGIATGNQTSFEFSPTLSLKTNKNTHFTLGYGLMNKTYSIGVLVPIPNPFKK